MPVYLAHGFKWPRDGYTGIRVHAIVHNLEDMSVEYIQNEHTRNALLENFRKDHPDIMKQLDDPRTGRTLHFLEQYDPDDELSDAAVSQKYAFVVDRVITIAAGNTSDSMSIPGVAVPASSQSRPSTILTSTTSTDSHRASASSKSTSPLPRHDPAVLSLNIEDAMSTGPAVTPQAWEALAELRDKIAEGEKIGWWVIYNGDPDRVYDDQDDNTETSSGSQEEIEDEGAKTPTQNEPNFNGLLGQPLPTLLLPSMKVPAAEEPVVEDDNSIGTAIPHPPPPPPPLDKPADQATNPAVPRPKSSRSFVNPLSIRRKSSKGNLQPPKDEDIPEPPKLKKINKMDGFRHKFFGSTDKK